MTLAQEQCSNGAVALDGAALAALLPHVPGWIVADGMLRRRYAMADWQAGVEFVNAVSTMVEQQNHHPLLTLSYGFCELAFTTHSAGNALSRNDFICAARADALTSGQP